MIYLGLGANLPFKGQVPAATIQAAIALLPEYGFEVEKVSSLYRSPPWLGLTQPDYVNAVVAVQSPLTPDIALNSILLLEEQFGRIRTSKNASRTLDIDIIDWQSQIIQQADLTIPHPFIAQRAFVLMPLKEIAPLWQHPQTGQSINQLIAGCADCVNIQRI